MDIILGWLREEQDVIRRARLATVLLVLFGATLGWAGSSFFWTRQVSDAQSALSTAQQSRDAWREAYASAGGSVPVRASVPADDRVAPSPGLTLITGAVLLALFGLIMFLPARRRTPNPKPLVNILLLGIRLSDSDEDGVSRLGIVIDTKVWNLGEETSIVDWKLDVHLTEGETLSMQSTVILAPIMRGTGLPFLTPTESLSAKLEGPSPLGREPVEGALFFTRKQSKIADIHHPQTVVELVAVDIYGNEFTARRAISEWGN